MSVFIAFSANFGGGGSNPIFDYAHSAKIMWPFIALVWIVIDGRK